MTKEERAVKWFRNVPGAEHLSLVEKMKICNQVAKGSVTIFLVLLIAEYIIVRRVGGGVLFDHMADVVNSFAAEMRGLYQHQFLALLGVILYIPFLVLPIAIGTIYWRNRLAAAARQAYRSGFQKQVSKISPTKVPQNESYEDKVEKNTEGAAEVAWLKYWENIKRQFDCRIDLESYFKKQKIGEINLDILDLGKVHFSTGHIVACDPCIELGDAIPYIQTIPAGLYPIKICVADTDYGILYACVKVEVSDKKPVRYELAMTGKEKLDQDFAEDDFFGFSVDAGMACIADQATQTAFHSYWQKRSSMDHSIDPFNDLLCDLLEENSKKYPKY